MHSLYLSLISEFYKSRKTLAFWAAILLPLIICGAISFGFYTSSDKVLSQHYSPLLLWLRYIGAALGVMGVLILPFYVIFMAFSVNNIEHRNDTWKTVFTLPLYKFSIYTAKFLFGIILISICLLLFGSLTLGFGHILQLLVPEYNFNAYNPSLLLAKFYLKLFLSSLGIFSIQFILSLIWGDFLKPMGIGFIGTIMGIITGNVGWKYAYLIPYSHPSLVLQSSSPRKLTNPADFEIFSQEVYTSLLFTAILFITGYFIVTKKSVR